MSQVKWNLDPAHSEITFKVKHMMIANVKGTFDAFDVQTDSESDDITAGKLSVAIEATSINTNNEQRDGHLRSADFFDVEQFPKITFNSSSFSKVSSEDFKLTGELTIKDVTKSITFDVEFGGVQKDPWGNLKAGFSVEGKISRSEFGLTWNAALETGGVMVSDEVKFSADIQFVKS